MTLFLQEMSTCVPCSQILTICPTTVWEKLIFLHCSNMSPLPWRQGAHMTSDLGLATLLHLFPSSIPGGNWGTDANLSVGDDKTFGMGPYCRMGLAAEPSSRVLHLGPALRILVTRHDSRLCKKTPGAFCVVAVVVVGLLRGLSTLLTWLLSQPYLLSMSHA